MRKRYMAKLHDLTRQTVNSRTVISPPPFKLRNQSHSINKWDAHFGVIICTHSSAAIIQSCIAALLVLSFRNVILHPIIYCRTTSRLTHWRRKIHSMLRYQYTQLYMHRKLLWVPHPARTISSYRRATHIPLKTHCNLWKSCQCLQHILSFR